MTSKEQAAMSEQIPKRLAIKEYENGKNPNTRLVMLRDEENIEGIECVRRPTARRIVACWDACAGIETEILETLVDHGVSLNTAANIATAEARADEAERLLAWAMPLLTGIFDHPDFAAAMKRENMTPGPDYEAARAIVDRKPND